MSIRKRSHRLEDWWLRVFSSVGGKRDQCFFDFFFAAALAFFAELEDLVAAALVTVVLAVARVEVAVVVVGVVVVVVVVPAEPVLVLVEVPELEDGSPAQAPVVPGESSRSAGSPRP